MFSVSSVCSRGGSYVTISHDALDLTTQGPFPLYMGPPPRLPHLWRLPAEARTVGERAVHILLEYCLVDYDTNFQFEKKMAV